MAAVTHAGTNFTTQAGNKTVIATPAVGDLIVVIASSTGIAGGTTAVTDDQGGTYTLVDSDRTGFSTTGVLNIFVRDTLVGSAVSTTYTAAQAASTGGGLTVLRVSGMTKTGATAVRGSGGQSTGTAGTTPAPVLSATPLTGNPIISAASSGNNPGQPATQRTGYASHAAVGFGTPTAGLRVTSLDSGETSATLTWASTSSTAFASIAVELDTSGAPPPIDGAASLTFAMTTVATGRVEKVGAATMTFAMATSVTGERTSIGAASLSFSMPIAVSGVRTTQSSASLTFAMSIVAAGEVVVPSVDGAASLSFSFTTTASGVKELVGTASLASSFAISATGRTEKLGAATLTFAMATSVTGRKEALGAATLTFAMSILAAGI